MTLRFAEAGAAAVGACATARGANAVVATAHAAIARVRELEDFDMRWCPRPGGIPTSRHRECWGEVGVTNGGIVTALLVHVKSGKAISTEHHLRVAVRGRT